MWFMSSGSVTYAITTANKLSTAKTKNVGLPTGLATRAELEAKWLRRHVYECFCVCGGLSNVWGELSDTNEHRG